MLVVWTTRNSEGQVELARLSINKGYYKVRQPCSLDASADASSEAMLVQSTT
jgi:hypothetical protein